MSKDIPEPVASAPAASSLSKKDILVVALVAPSLLIVSVFLFFRSSDVSPVSSPSGSPRHIPNPATAMAELRKSWPARGRGAEARRVLLGLGDSALPTIQTAVRSSVEVPGLRMELVSLLSDMRSSSADAALIQLFRDRSLEEKFRALALARLSGRRSPPVIQGLREVYAQEPGFGARHLILKCLGEAGDSADTQLLERAAKEEMNADVRLQAVSTLASRMADPRVGPRLLDVLLQDPEENVKLAALSALGPWRDPSAAEAFRSLSSDAAVSVAVREAAKAWIVERERRP